MSKNEYGYIGAGIIPTGLKPFSFKDKAKNVENMCRYMLARTNHMFKYSGLPDTIPHRALETYLQCNGYTVWAENPVDRKLYVFYGELGAYPDVYYMPTKAIVANPALKLTKEYVIGEDCIVMKSDTSYIGLLPIFRKWSTLLAENELTIYSVDTYSRIMAVISASTSSTKKEAELFLKKIENGDLSVIGGNTLGEMLKIDSLMQHSGVNITTQFIELEQYIKASMWNEIGLNANYNMKRETITANESQLNVDALTPLIDDMLQCRKDGVEEVNQMFGTNITVDFDMIWFEKFKEEELERQILENEANSSQLEYGPEKEEESDSEENTDSSQQENEKEGDVN